jgi:hypothetical protein
MGVGSGVGAGVGSGVGGGGGGGVGIGVGSGVGAGVGGGVGTGVGAGVGGAGVGGSVRTGFAPGKTCTIATRPLTTVATGEARAARVGEAVSLAVRVAHAPPASASPTATTDIEIRRVRDNELPPPAGIILMLFHFTFSAFFTALSSGEISVERRRSPSRVRAWDDGALRYGGRATQGQLRRCPCSRVP